LSKNNIIMFNLAWILLITTLLSQNGFATPPHILHATSKTFRLTKLNSQQLQTCMLIDLLTLSWDQPLYIHTTTSSHPPSPINGFAVQHMLDQKTITFHGDPTRCLSFRTFAYDRQRRRETMHNGIVEEEDDDILRLVQQSTSMYDDDDDDDNNQRRQERNLMRFIQRSPCDDTTSNDGAAQCYVQLNDTSIGNYHRSKIFFDDSDVAKIKFFVRSNIEQVYSFNIRNDDDGSSSWQQQAGVITEETSSAQQERHDEIQEKNHFWGGTCSVVRVPQSSTRSFRSSRSSDTTNDEYKQMNTTTLSLLETKDRMSIMTQVFKGLVTDVIDGTVAGAAGPALEQTEERAGTSDTDDMRGEFFVIIFFFFSFFFFFFGKL